MLVRTKTIWVAALGVLLALWITWLRWPTFDAIWNLDEGIHTTIARTILDGGVMYRDAIDQRTPLTYYFTAGVFSVVGLNNLWALHLVLAGIISATGFALFLIARQWHGTVAGIWAAGIFAALSSSLFYPGDAYAYNTEWFVILFTSWSAWWFWRSWSRPRFWSMFGVGVGYAAAFLCKQPGLLDFGVPFLVIVHRLAINRISAADARSLLAALALGFLTVTSLAFGYFWWRGALADFYFYAWTYNLVYYGADIHEFDRLRSLAALGGILRIEYPLVLLAVLATVIMALIKLIRSAPAGGTENTQAPAIFLLAWLVLSCAGALSAGRVYGHYYIQTLPAIALAAAWMMNALTVRIFANGNRWLKLTCTALVLTTAVALVVSPLRGRSRPRFGPDASMTAAEFVRARSEPNDRVFVWGYHPDFYLYADRAPASRFIYCSFLTGLVPWLNTAPDQDTSYAIVPGTMETLLQELDHSRPAFVVDTSLAPYRGFAKYPLEKFPRLDAFIAANYLEVDAEKFRPHGFRVLMLTDSGRRTPWRLVGDRTGGMPGAATVTGLTVVEPKLVEYQITGTDPAGRLQRLELLVDDSPYVSVSFPPTNSLTARVNVDFGKLGTGVHSLCVRATTARGAHVTGPALAVSCTTESLPAERLAEFALFGNGPAIIPARVRAPFGAVVVEEAGKPILFAHAPSTVTYPLPADAKHFSGRFGFRAGAYAPENAGRTDGAEFIVRTVDGAGRRRELFRQWLRPFENPADRDNPAFAVSLPAWSPGAVLELEITPGPSGNNASDWTYWSDLNLKTSR